MLVSKRDATHWNRIEILAQRYHDRTALIASWKIREHNIIYFKSRSMRGLYYASGPAIRKCSIKEIKARSGNMVRMYELPLDDLEPLEFKEDLAEYAKSLFNN